MVKKPSHRMITPVVVNMEQSKLKMTLVFLILFFLSGRYQPAIVSTLDPFKTIWSRNSEENNRLTLSGSDDHLDSRMAFDKQNRILYLVYVKTLNSNNTTTYELHMQKINAETGHTIDGGQGEYIDDITYQPGIKCFDLVQDPFDNSFFIAYLDTQSRIITKKYLNGVATGQFEEISGNGIDSQSFPLAAPDYLDSNKLYVIYTASNNSLIRSSHLSSGGGNNTLTITGSHAADIAQLRLAGVIVDTAGDQTNVVVWYNKLSAMIECVSYSHAGRTPYSTSSVQSLVSVTDQEFDTTIAIGKREARILWITYNSTLPSTGTDELFVSAFYLRSTVGSFFNTEQKLISNSANQAEKLSPKIAIYSVDLGEGNNVLHSFFSYLIKDINNKARIKIRGFEIVLNAREMSPLGEWTIETPGTISEFDMDVPTVTEDQEPIALLTYTDSNSGSTDIYASAYSLYENVNNPRPPGPIWTGPLLISSAHGEKKSISSLMLDAVSDGGGALFAAVTSWSDARGGYRDIYGAFLESYGYFSGILGDQRPYPPQDLTHLLDNDRVTLEWNQPEPSLVEQYIVYKLLLSDPNPRWMLIERNLNPEATLYRDQGIEELKRYAYRIHVVPKRESIFLYFRNQQGYSDSEEIAIPLFAPTDLQSLIISGIGIGLSWTNKSLINTGYRIERSTNGSDFTELTSLPANVTSYVDTDLIQNTSYSYKVFADHDSGARSAYSNIVSINSGGLGAPPDNPVVSSNASQAAPNNNNFTPVVGSNSKPSMCYTATSVSKSSHSTLVNKLIVMKSKFLHTNTAGYISTSIYDTTAQLPGYMATGISACAPPQTIDNRALFHITLQIIILLLFISVTRLP